MTSRYVTSRRGAAGNHAPRRGDFGGNYSQRREKHAVCTGKLETKLGAEEQAWYKLFPGIPEDIPLKPELPEVRELPEVQRGVEEPEPGLETMEVGTRLKADLD